MFVCLKQMWILSTTSHSTVLAKANLNSLVTASLSTVSSLKVQRDTI